MNRFAFAALLFLALPAAAAEPFQASAPSGWESLRDANGATFTGPRDDAGVAARITVNYAKPGASGTADDYLARLTAKPDVPLPGWTTGPVRKTTVAGRASRRVDRVTSEFVPPSARNTREIAMTEIHVVVPAAKGYYVILYYAPASLDAAGKPALASVLAGFKPKL